MKDASKNDESPFLELNDEIPAQWAIDSEASSSQAMQSPLSERAQEHPVLERNQRRASRQLGAPRYALTTPSKVVLSMGVVLVLLMTLFRVPPALVLIGLFSVLRVLFFPLAIFGFVWWAWRHRR